MSAPAASTNPPATTQAPTPAMQDEAASLSPHERIVRCNDEATNKHLKGPELQSFLNTCLSEQNPT
jgi:hypothetical protein